MNIAQTLVTVDSADWIPVSVPSATVSGRPFNAKKIVFINNEAGCGDVYRRLVADTIGTQITIAAGTQEEWIMSDDPRALTGYAAAQNGETVAYLKSVSGSFDVLVLFIG